MAHTTAMLLEELAGSPPQTVLLVEDQIELSLLMQEILEIESFHVQSVNSIEAAHASAQNIRPDIVIADLNLPDGNGLKLLQEFAENNRFDRGVLTTGDPGKVQLSDLPDNVVLLGKPFRASELLTVVLKDSSPKRF